MNENIKHFIDAISVGSAVAVITNVIPILVGVLTIAWAAYRLYDIHLAVQIKKKQLKEE